MEGTADAVDCNQAYMEGPKCNVEEIKGVDCKKESVEMEGTTNLVDCNKTDIMELNCNAE